MKKIPTFLEYVNDWLNHCYDEYKKDDPDDDEYHEKLICELIKCEASEEYKMKNINLYNDIHKWMIKWFGEDKTIGIMNEVYRHLRELKDNYIAIMLDESYGI